MFLRLMVVAALLTACGSKKAPAPASSAPKPAAAAAPQAATQTTAAAPAAAPDKAAAPQPAKPAPTMVVADITTAQVNGLVEQWVKSQNDGDFEAYQSLYAEKFFGTKRSGKNQRSFERKGWLRDRKRMFGKRMTVSVSGVEMSRTAESAVVHFEQEWASGRYKDAGPKQLVLVRQGGELRIAREEMLRSVVGDGRDKSKALEVGRYHFVVQDKETYVILDAAPSGDWTKGEELRLLSADAYASVTSPANLKMVPEKYLAFQGKKMRFYGPNGEVCRGQVVSLEVMSRVRPHFGTVNYWNRKEAPRPSKKVVTREAWRLGDIGRVLVGRVIPMAGNDCRSASWARDAALDSPKLLESQRVEPELVVKALRKFEKLKGYKDIQASYVKEVPLPRPVKWHKYGDASPTISALKSADGVHQFISIAVKAGDPCALQFDTEFWAIWRVIGVGKRQRLQLISDEVHPGALFVPRGGADVDQDGRYEFFGNDALVQPAGAVVRESLSVSVPSLDCGC